MIKINYRPEGNPLACKHQRGALCLRNTAMVVTRTKTLMISALKNRTKGIQHSLCRSCMSEYSKELYKNNKQVYLDKTKKRNQRVSEDNRTKLFVYLSQHPCVDCGEADPYVLEFDHVRGKKSNNITKMVMDGYSWSTIEAEIAKCEVRCANCHRIRENKKGSSWRHLLGFQKVDTLMKKICSRCDRERDAEKDFSKGHAWCKSCRAEYVRHRRANDENKQRLYAYLASHPCIDCGETDIRCLEFDHVRGNKSSSIATLIKNGASWSVIEAEIAKCEVRCANCHRIKTIEHGGWWRFGRS